MAERGHKSASLVSRIRCMSNGHLADQYASSLGTLYVFLRTCRLVSSVNRNEVNFILISRTSFWRFCFTAREICLFFFFGNDKTAGSAWDVSTRTVVTAKVIKLNFPLFLFCGQVFWRGRVLRKYDVFVLWYCEKNV